MKAVAKAEHDDEAMIYLLKPSLMTVAGLTPCVAVAKATAVAELTIKQFLGMHPTAKVVAGPCLMAMTLLLYRDAESHTHARGCGENRQRER